MAEPITNELLYEVLRSIQSRLSRLEDGQEEIRAELHATGEHLAALSSSYAALVGDGVRRGDELNALRRRIERLERRVDLTDPPA
jgi:predicted nuclease with TOPRIM domain